MKKLIFTIFFLGILSYGGGDITPVTNYELEDEYIVDTQAVDYTDSSDIVEVEQNNIDYEEEIVTQDNSEEDIIDYIPSHTPEPTMVVTPTPVPTPLPTPTPSIKKEPKMVNANGFYVGLGINGTRYKDSCHCSTDDGIVKIENKDTTYGVVGRVGYDFNQYVGVEVRGVKTNWKSDGSKVSHVGAFLKPMVPVTNNANIYGLIGVAKTKTDGSMPNVDSTALSVGGGIEIDISKDVPKKGRYNRPFDGHGDQESGLGLFLDYERMVVKEGAPRLDSVSAGLTYDF